MGLKRRSIKKSGWEPLRPGAIVDVVAPASKCSLEELNAGVKVLESWDLQVRVSPDIFGENLLHAQDDKIRWQQFRKALLAKDSSVIWCARGGYGSMKLLPSLAKMKKPSHSKLLVGLSDITSLNVFLNQKWKWPVLHAPILSRVGRGDLPSDSMDELKQILFGEKAEVAYDLKPMNQKAKTIRLVKGPLVGGNWATMMAGLATPFELRPRGTILFLEDVGERGYKLDRFWEQLSQMKFLDKVSAIIFGDFTEGNEPNGTSLMWEVLRLRAEAFHKPVYCGIPAGHGSIQRALPLGLEMQIVQSKGIIKASLPTGVSALIAKDHPTGRRGL
jgi:muramoyltetrapeptide carboxypeptidase